MGNRKAKAKERAKAGQRGAGRGPAWTGQAAATGGRALSGTVTSTQVTRPQKKAAP